MFKNIQIPLTISLLIGGFFGGISPALAQVSGIENQLCQQYEQVPGSGQQIDCSQGFDEGYQVGLEYGQEYRESEGREQRIEAEIEAMIPNDATEAYRNGFMSGYRVGFQEGYQL
ncbi:hypothetical protein ACL6C3_20410 [Capilliphycus salinus ALCB114379]|uniref:hypothetical protein n=1 Tax=Capilliphycus salinus TaxID=2768948 RepID=UPI0039A442C7